MHNIMEIKLIARNNNIYFMSCFAQLFLSLSLLPVAH